MSNWHEEDGTLHARFEFDDFTQALEFVNKVGQLAEEANHHPDITFGWGYVVIKLTTHSKNMITDKDYALAQRINGLHSAA